MLCALKDNPNRSAARFAFEANQVVKCTVHKTVEERSPSGAVSTSSRFLTRAVASLCNFFYMSAS